MSAADATPFWSIELRRRYLKGEACQFVLHGNVHDLIVHEGTWYTLVDYLGKVLLPRTKDVILRYNVSQGVRFLKKSGDVAGLDELLLHKSRGKVLPAIERLLDCRTRVAVIFDYAEMLAPTGDANLFSDADRESLVTLHRWSQSMTLDESDNLVLLLSENITELNSKLVANPRNATLAIPLPDATTRAVAIAQAATHLRPDWRDPIVEATAGLKSVQIKGLLQPTAQAPVEKAEREAFLLQLLQQAPQAAERAAKLSHLTLGMTLDEIRDLVAPQAQVPDADDGKAEVLRLIAQRKREIIERECVGLVEFVDSPHDFSVVGGLQAVKAELLAIAAHMREGRRARCPMGLLFTGPMGTGKTFVAEAFAKEAGVTAIKLKNFRSKWVGSTEGNLERIFSVVQAIGQVIIIIDEGDRAFGNSDDGEGDGGTGARVIGRIKEFMSDTRNRGRIMFILMTNRPDKLDVDIKRAGRLDRKIPFLYPQTSSEVEAVLVALVRKHAMAVQFGWDESRATVTTKLVGYSNAEIEAVVLLANDYAAAAPLHLEHMQKAMRDYIASRDAAMLEFMELLAVFETSNRQMLPAKYASLDNDALQARLSALRLAVGQRR